MTNPRQDLPDADRDTVRLLRDRDQEGLRLLLANFGPKIKWYLRRKLNLRGEAIQDALNRSAFRAWRSIAKFDPEKGALGSWFFRIAYNVGLSILQEQAKHRSVNAIEDWDAASFMALHQPVQEDSAAPPAGPDGVDEAVAATPKQNEFLNAFWGCVQKLTRRQRQVILADLQEGDVADAKQLAVELETSVNSIYVSRSQARKALKDGMQLLGFFLDSSGGIGESGGSSPFQAHLEPKPRNTGRSKAGDP